MISNASCSTIFSLFWIEIAVLIVPTSLEKEGSYLPTPVRSYVCLCICNQFNLSQVISVTNLKVTYGSGHSVCYNIVCASSEDSDQPAHPRSLIRVFAARLRRIGSLATHRVPCENSDQTARMRRLIWVFIGRTCNLVQNAAPRLICLENI